MDNEKNLAQIKLKQPCVIRAVEGTERLRLFDLGFFRGSLVLPMYVCAGGGTRVYRVKDTLIALRDQDAAAILVEEGLSYAE